ncbi:hypothetical protein PV10_01064 [Exophiala mesophila]|uniref:Cytochrome P450 n=1 Tax=Exophiala mesophila TaxID=212818 RepID=A0A0D1ZRR5_EXOME|nr:uncharacterized protein PV10_01064 [Exophiala mesophila]KIV97297.1 hypothetical protein PV10_01064 [Exophiala mesophila]
MPGRSPTRRGRRWETSKKYGLSRDYLGRSELELLNGLLRNTVPAVFWILAHIIIAEHGSFSEQIDEEIGDFVQQEEHQLGFDIGQTRKRCPILDATYQEALRLHASSARAYKVVEDFETADGCLLKIGSLVYVPTETIHKNSKNWGADVLQFRPDRWLKSLHDHHPGSYAPFGVGSSICPGRHFVFDMILGSLVVLLYSFNLQAAPSPGSAMLKAAERRSRIMSGMRLPTNDIDVLLSRMVFADDRQDSSTVRWSFERLREGRNGKDNIESTGKTL